MFVCKMHRKDMSYASAHAADAAFSCPRCASMDASSNIAIMLDAIIMASILFISLICGGNVVMMRNVGIVLVVLAAVLAGRQMNLFANVPKMRMHA